MNLKKKKQKIIKLVLKLINFFIIELSASIQCGSYLTSAFILEMIFSWDRNRWSPLIFILSLFNAIFSLGRLLNSRQSVFSCFSITIIITVIFCCFFFWRLLFMYCHSHNVYSEWESLDRTARLSLAFLGVRKPADQAFNEDIRRILNLRKFWIGELVVPHYEGPSPALWRLP